MSVCHRTEFQILLGLKTTGRFGSKIHFTPADTLWTIHTSQVVWVRFYSLSSRVRTKHGEEEFAFYASHSWAEKHFAHIHLSHEIHVQSPAHCLNCIEKVGIWIYFCNTVHQRWNELPKNPDKMKKTQQDCSTEGLDISVCYNLVINEIILHIKCFTHFSNIFYFFIVSHLILL